MHGLKCSNLLGLALSGAILAGASLAVASPAAPITLRVSQSGFAGVTGTQYVVAPDGKWQASTFVDETATGAAGAGELPRTKVEEFASALSALDLTQAALAAKSYEGVNPSFVELQFGDQKVKFSLQPGYTLEQPCPLAEAAACQLLGIARSIEQSLTK